MEEITLSVVIVNYNVKYFLEQCLYSLRAALQGMEAEVFVVDNNSTDGSVAYLKPNFPEVTFIENSDNPGFAKANNQAIRLARGKYILLLNPDTVIGEDSIRSLCYFLEEKPKAGALGVKMIDGNGVFLPESKRSFPTPWVSFCKMFGLSKLFPKNPRFAKYSLPYLNPDARHKVDVLAGAFMLIRKEALDKAGLLDEDFFMYGEDIDLSYRLKLAGYKNYYMPERILHYKGESTSKGNIKYVKIFYGAMLIFYRKHYSGAGKLFSLLIRLAVWFRALLDLVFHASANKKTKVIPQASAYIEQRNVARNCANRLFETDTEPRIRKSLEPRRAPGDGLYQPKQPDEGIYRHRLLLQRCTIRTTPAVDG